MRLGGWPAESPYPSLADTSLLAPETQALWGDCPMAQRMAWTVDGHAVAACQSIGVVIPRWPWVLDLFEWAQSNPPDSWSTIILTEPV